jgi:hypothetical protein
MASFRFCASLGLVALTTLACSGKDPYSPGTKLGTFHVTAQLTTSSCGAVPNPWEFDVQLNHDGSTIYWVQGQAPIQGRVDSAAHASLATSFTEDLRAADERAKKAACSVTRSDALTMNLADAAAKPTADPATMTGFTGVLAYAFLPTDGSDCSDQVATEGGDFDALPCEVRYDLTGTLKAAPSP